MSPKVYTHYTPLQSGSDGIRWRTLLQFGDSWTTQGTVVMKNPGKANFLHPDKRAINDSHTLQQLAAFDDGVPQAPWFEFRADPTMRCIGKLFDEYYTLRGQKLNGIVQIYNLFYLREANLAEALHKAKRYRLADMSAYDISHTTAPVYLGFADLAHHRQHCATAKKFFDRAQELGMRNLDDNFLANDFIHPLYLMLYGKNAPKCQAARAAFLHNCPASELDRHNNTP